MSDDVASFEAMWRDLEPVGRSARSGGYFRQPFSAAERECQAWFREQCGARGLDVQTDAVGNTVAWWGGPPVAGGPKAVLTGSHLD
ncbi:MAG: allantoate amidohydrolase, partial [Nocardioidaceae bacterium]